MTGFVRAVAIVCVLICMNVGLIGCGKQERAKIDPQVSSMQQAEQNATESNNCDTVKALEINATYYYVDTLDRDKYAWVSEYGLDGPPMSDSLRRVQAGRWDELLKKAFTKNGRNSSSVDTAVSHRNTMYQAWYPLPCQNDSIYMLPCEWNNDKKKVKMRYASVHYSKMSNYYHYLLTDYNSTPPVPLTFTKALDTNLVEGEDGLDVPRVDTILTTNAVPRGDFGNKIIATKDKLTSIRFKAIPCGTVDDTVRGIIMNSLLSNQFSKDFYWKVALYKIGERNGVLRVAGELFQRCTQISDIVASICIIADIKNGNCSISYLVNRVEWGVNFVGAYSFGNDTLADVYQTYTYGDDVLTFFYSHGVLVNQ